MAVEDWSTTAAANTSLGGISLAENGMAPSNVNDAFREMMAQLATYTDGLTTGDDKQPLDATLTAFAALAIAANKLPYGTGTDTFALTDITAYGRTLLGLADAAALKANLSAVTVVDSTLSTNGHISFDVNGDGVADFKINWGTGTWASSTSFESAFTTACWVVIPIQTSLIGESDESDEIMYLSSQSVSGFTTAIKGDYTSAPSLAFIALGK